MDRGHPKRGPLTRLLDRLAPVCKFCGACRPLPLLGHYTHTRPCAVGYLRDAAETERDTCSHIHREPLTSSHIHRAWAPSQHLVAYCRESCTACMYPERPTPCPHRKSFRWEDVS